MNPGLKAILLGMRTYSRLFSKALWETGICLFLGAGSAVAAGIPMPETLDRRGLDRFFDNAAAFGRFEPLAATPAPQAPPGGRVSYCLGMAIYVASAEGGPSTGGVDRETVRT